MINLNNKWFRAAIPALLIHCSIGTVYCWSTFKESIATSIGMSTFSVGWAFSLAIFFLGMSAAFAGRLVEKNIKLSSLLSCICFTVGMIGTGLSINYLTGTKALIAIYLFYGCIMGVGLGIGYLTPVKTLMLWFFKNKGLGTGISIMGFGLAKAIATPIMELLQRNFGISAMFYILGAIYFCMMLLGHALIRKPDGWVESDSHDSHLRLGELIKNPVFVGIWVMFFINIHCGLALITYEKQIVGYVFIAVAAVAIIPSITAAFNALGRIGLSTISDSLDDRNDIYKLIFATAFFATLTTLVLGMNVVTVVLLLIIVNTGYGGGFSTLPALLASRFGMENISKIHGIALSAWAVAGLTGNNMSALILSNGGGYKTICIFTLVLYLIAFIVSNSLIRNKKRGAL